MTAPVTISYGDNNIKFHAVVSEDHEATTQITQYPTQSGFSISDHAIRKNRVIKLKGIFTNTILEGSNQHKYSSTNTPKEMFKVLNALVRSATTCLVRTNLGTYTPVVFVSFKNVQKEGIMDSMKFDLVGQEVQIANETARTSPISISLDQVSEIERSEIKKAFEDAELDPAEASIPEIKQAPMTIGEDFKLAFKDASGRDREATFICHGYDKITDQYNYELHRSNPKDLFEDSFLAEVVDGVNIVPPAWSLGSGLVGASNCILDKSIDAGLAFVEDQVNTAIGYAKESVYGFVEGIFTVDGSGPLQTVMGIAMDCVVIEAGKAYDDYLYGEEVERINELDQENRAREEAGLDPLTGKESSYEDKELELSIASVTSMGKQVIVGGFPVIESKITQVFNPNTGALSKLGDTVRSFL